MEPRKFDDKEINQYRGRFARPFDMDPEDGSQISHDDVVHFLVRARATKANVSESKDGDLVRTNVFSVTDVALMVDEDVNKAAAAIFLEENGIDLYLDDEEQDAPGEGG